MPAAESTTPEAELARLLGVTRPAVMQWRQAGCPFRRKSGRYEYVVAEVVEWRLERARATQRAEEAPDEGVERARKLRADADLAELKLAERRRQVADIAAAAREAERLMHLLRSRVLSLRGRWQPRILGLGTMAEAAAVLDALTDDVLASLRQGADEMDAAEEAEAA